MRVAVDAPDVAVLGADHLAQVLAQRPHEVLETAGPGDEVAELEQLAGDQLAGREAARVVGPDHGARRDLDEALDDDPLGVVVARDRVADLDEADDAPPRDHGQEHRRLVGARRLVVEADPAERQPVARRTSAARSP